MVCHAEQKVDLDEECSFSLVHFQWMFSGKEVEFCWIQDGSGHSSSKANFPTYQLFSDDQVFHTLNLGNMVFISFELSLANPLIDPHQHLLRNVLPIIHPCQKNKDRVTINSRFMDDAKLPLDLTQQVKIPCTWVTDYCTQKTVVIQYSPSLIPTKSAH